MKYIIIFSRGKALLKNSQKKKGKNFMRTTLLVLLTLTVFIFTGCGGNSIPTNPSAIGSTGSTDSTKAKLLVQVGSKNRSLKSSSVSVKVSEPALNDSNNFLNHSKSICLQVERDNEIINGACSPTLLSKDGKVSYPKIEIELSEGSYKLQLVAYSYVNTYYKSTSDIVGKSNTIIQEIDETLIALGLQKDVYVGNLIASYSTQRYYFIKDSSGEIDMNQGYIVSFVTTDGEKISKEVLQNDYSYNRTELGVDFWIEKNTKYSKICINNDCRLLSNNFDFFEENIDFANMQKVEMIPVVSDDICSISYNQDEHTIIDMSNKYIYENYIHIGDCDMSRYKFEVEVYIDELDDYDMSLYGDKSRYTSVTSVDGKNVFSITSDTQNTYFFIAFTPKTVEAVEKIFTPSMTIRVLDNLTDELVQINNFDLTTFEFINIDYIISN